MTWLFKTLWLAAAAGALAFAAACDGPSPAEQGAASTTKDAAPLPTPAQRAVRAPGAIYKRAYEQAKEAITADNASQVLDAMDAQIEREMELQQ